MSDVAGYFVWTRGLRGPCPVKINADLYRHFASTEAGVPGALCAPQPLTESQFGHTTSLDDLAALFSHLRPAD